MVLDTPHRHDIGTYAIDVDRGFVLFTYHRQPSYDEWRALVASAFEDPAFRKGMSVVSDRRALTETHEPDAIRRMAQFLSTIPAVQGCLWAVVSDPRPVAELGMTNMGQVLFEYGARITIQRFADVDAAIRWVTARRA